MAISLSDLRQVKATLPPRVICFGVQGIGKTSLAMEFPSPVFLQCEEGTPGGGAELTSFGRLTCFQDVMDALGALYSEEHTYKTVVVDTLDALEPWVWTQTCLINKWDSIESPGYGKGFLEADTQWREFLDGVAALRRDRAMCVLLLAHCSPERFEDPVIGPYARYNLNIHKRGAALLKYEADILLFANYAASVQKTDTGFNRQSRHAEGGGKRMLYTEERPAFYAKNRFNMPPIIPFEKGQAWAALSPYLPGFDTEKMEAA